MREPEPDVSEVLNALSGVRDPELDESITELGFVGDVSVEEGGAVRVDLRLPTFFCAANFAYLMAYDAHEAIKALPGVQDVYVQLEDHFASDEINDGVANERGFEGTFEGLADGDVDELRQIFRRKALISRQDQLARTLMASGYDPESLTTMVIGDLPDGEETQTYLQRRGELGLDTSSSAPLLVNAAGRPIPGDEARGFLRHGRTTRLNIEANAGFCRAVLQARYPNGSGSSDDEVPASSSAGSAPEGKGANA